MRVQGPIGPLLGLAHPGAGCCSPAALAGGRVWPVLRPGSKLGRGLRPRGLATTWLQL